jgi:hypothetical protein
MLVRYGLGNWLETMKCQGYYQKNNSFKLITKHEKQLCKKKSSMGTHPTKVQGK